jgi:kynurenine formamidase
MARPTKEEVIGFIDSLSNWGRWGPDDELGTLNFIDAAKRLAAVALVQDGRSVSCSRVLSTAPSDENPFPLLHFMIRSGEGAAAEGRSTASDWIGLRFHGRGVTHLDALSHFFWNRQAYNGRPAEGVSSAGAAFHQVGVARDGIVTRGVLLDVCRSEGVDYLPLDHEVTVEELERCEQAEGVRVGTGDVLMVRTGRDARADDHRMMGPLAGLGADCLPWLHDREVSVLVGDGVQDVQPEVYPGLVNPIHIVTIVGMGMWLLDNAYLEDVAAYAASAGRWAFLFVTSPLLLDSTTGSPTNPLAIF